MALTSMSPLPLPARPVTCQVSNRVTWLAGKTIIRASGAPLGSRRGLPFS